MTQHLRLAISFHVAVASFSWRFHVPNNKMRPTCWDPCGLYFSTTDLGNVPQQLPQCGKVILILPLLLFKQSNGALESMHSATSIVYWCRIRVRNVMQYLIQYGNVCSNLPEPHLLKQEIHADWRHNETID